jgi:hypothetical protein
LPAPVPLRMPDATPFSLVGTTYGREHQYVDGRLYQRALHGNIPQEVWAKVGCPVLFARPLQDVSALGLWIDTDADLGLRERVTVVDEAGNEGADLATNIRICSLSPEETAPPQFDGITAIDGTRCWLASQLPRRARTFRFRVYPAQSAGLTGFAEFAVPNPEPRDYPRWSPEPLPSVRRAGSLEVSLRRLEWGVSPSKRTMRALPGEKGWTRVVLRIKDAVYPADSWALRQVTLSDATGNQRSMDSYTSDPPAVIMDPDEDLPPCDRSRLCPDVLWPGEAWKVRAELVRAGSPNARWESAHRLTSAPALTRQVIEFVARPRIGPGK